MAIIKIVTHFGDLVVVLPLALAALAWLAHIGSRRLIFYWVSCLLACTLITITLKMYFLSCPSSLFGLRSPSGHASLSILVYGAFGTIAAKGAGRARRFTAAAITVSLVAAIAGSRAMLGAHTALEVVIGLAIGGLTLIPFTHAYLGAGVKIEMLSPAPLLALLALLVIAPAALTLESPDTEKILGTAAAHLQEVAPICATEGRAAGEAAQ